MSLDYFTLQRLRCMEKESQQYDEQPVAPSTTKLVNTEIHDVHGIVVSGGSNNINITFHDGKVTSNVSQSTTKRKTRTAKCFADYILDKKCKKALMEKFHTIVPGKKGKDLMLIMRSALLSNHLQSIPPHSAIAREFADVGTRQSYLYYKDFAFLQDEIVPIIDYLSK